ncbi:rhodanese-like domain-containing protein [Pseudoalteromonas xiamenensis]|uniref:rhodanese-like domain-containing protein n=1 Tax=Pseudoalteromonas xiamenensis TaxID=882626 RepID=UPI0027E3F47D|nr:rhodanese-like domain-containing protein [Pseudoalteromonas xiamenensis]WMN60707.1 rhodanese-like domain-containing protein [Pseudoalteromonas xiamenensis]WMN60813.1 rhodanese-like domain-containing protein [Pseudoalteromonas xiamenensis]
MIKSSQQLVEQAKGAIREVTVTDLFEALQHADSILIDVREPEEFNAGHLANSVNFPRGVLEMKIHLHPLVCDLCDKDALECLAHRPIYLICRSGARSALAALSLKEMGFDQVYSVAGGFIEWVDNNLPVEHRGQACA